MNDILVQNNTIRNDIVNYIMSLLINVNKKIILRYYKNLKSEDVLAPPIAPADIICINVINGKTKARLANDTFPNFDTKYASEITINTIEIPVIEFGNESLQIIFRTGPLRIKSRLFFINKNY